MKIINNTDTDLIVRNTIGSKKIFAGTFSHIDPKFDNAVITCCYGQIDIIIQEIDNRFHLYPYDNLDATYEFDSKYNDFVVEVFHVTAAEKRSNHWFEQQDKTLHDKSIRDASIHLTSAHTTAYKRIDELTDAIKKSIQKCVPNDDTSDVKQIRNWAKEIMFQCNIIDSIDED